MPQHDLIVIGAGPGGYVAAIRAAQLGMNVGVVEKEPALGGTCLRVGCIPSKALLESSERYHEAAAEFAQHGVRVGNLSLDLPTLLRRKDDIVRGLTEGVAGLFRKNKITRYSGTARFAGTSRGEGGRPAHRVDVFGDTPAPAQLEAPHVIIATGSVPARLPGAKLSGDRIGTSTEALSYPEVPRHLIVIGAGYIGLELGCVWRRLGAQVTVVEFLPRILPGMDGEIADLAQRVLTRQGIEFRLGAKVTSARSERNVCTVECEGGEPLRGDRVLVAIGRVPNTDGLGLDAVGLELDPKGRVPVNEHFETSVPGVYAIGDVIRGPMLAHKAEDEGVACVEQIVHGHSHVNYDAIPGVVYTNPEIASVGRTEEQLKEAGIACRKGIFHFKAASRARAMGQTDGRVKVLADAKTDRLLGVHILGPHAGDLIAEAAVAIEFGASSEDIARCSHAHPTLAEALKEAALAVAGRAIHA